MATTELPLSQPSKNELVAENESGKKSATKQAEILPLDADIERPTQAFTRLKRAWRIEVKNSGKDWGWRKGSDYARESRRGGKFSDLSPERQAAYWRNVKTKSRSRRGGNTR